MTIMTSDSILIPGSVCAYFRVYTYTDVCGCVYLYVCVYQKLFGSLWLNVDV